MNLNEEHGKIKKPYVPVLRFARPVIGDNNVRYGVAVLNVYADSFLERIGRNVEKGRQRYLISSDGNYFYHPHDKAWGHLLGNQTGFQSDFPEIFKRLANLENGAFSLDKKIICFERIYPHPQNTEDFWILIEIMNDTAVMRQQNKFIQIFISIFLATLLLVFLTTRYVIGGLMRPLFVITRQLQQLSLGKISKEKLFYTGNDEIAQMMEYTDRLVSYMEDLSNQADKISAGNYTESVSILSEQDKLGNAVNNMTLIIRENQEKNERRNWLNHGQGKLDSLLRGEQTVEEMADKIVTFLSTYLQAAIGTFYLIDNDGAFRLHASYAYRKRKNVANIFRPGEGMVGQAALEKKIIIISNVPERYLQVCSALGEGEPASLLITPFLYNNQVKAVLEVGSFIAFTELQINFIEQIADRIGIALNSAQSRVRMQEMLQVTQQQASDLQAQQEELTATNEEMEEQTQRLRASEEELQANQEQLVTTNDELEEKNRSLNRQKQKIEQTNKDLRHSRKEIEHKAEEVARASKYKSEFLANMSHELRTPLNSLLLLAQTLEKNRQGNLTEDDIESVQIIHKSGNELLSLINEILDLSKIEAGHMKLVREIIPVSDLLEEIKNTFQHLADEKRLTLNFTVAEDVPQAIESDQQRLEQVLNNLLSNAVKFTDEGTITVSVAPMPAGIALRRTDLQAHDTIAIAVQDSGIGISDDKQKIIFEAFQQADGGTARQYGGTGLGLSISRELAGLLGGEIHLKSKEGEGSTFTLYLPMRLQEKRNHGLKQDQGEMRFPSQVAQTIPVAVTPVADDRHDLKKNDRIVLVIEDDANFATLLVRQCHEKGLRCIAVPTGEEGLRAADMYLPSAIILDLQLPGISGWNVLETLKEQTKTRHIPVHIMSIDDAGIDARRKGAVEALQKPLTSEQLELALLNINGTLRQQIRTLLVAAQDAEQRENIITLVGNNDVRSEEASSGREVPN
ncbi:MAG: response regulator, partial [Candidatus Electrothrix sp. AR4]|nr:response regulator [Candidatus Electrothrix sp. AR4]